MVARKAMAALLVLCGMASACHAREMPEGPPANVDVDLNLDLDEGPLAQVHASDVSAGNHPVAVPGGRGSGGAKLPPFYKTLDEVYAEVRRLVNAAGDWMTLEEVPIAYDSRGGEKHVMPVVRVRGATRKDPHRMLVSFGEHGREFITTEVALAFLRLLAETKAEGGNENDATPEVQKMAAEAVESTEFTLVMVSNPAGRKLAETQDVCSRTNGRGVDLNRNWPLDWGVKEKDYQKEEENPGQKPLSEPETQVLMDLALDTAPDVWVSVHSGMAALLHPWDYRVAVAEGEPDMDRVRSLLDAVKQRHCAPGQGHALGGSVEECVVGAASKHVGYLAHGTAADTMHGVLRVPLASTWEIYGVTDAGYDACLEMFNPVDEVSYRDVRSNWGAALLTAATALDGIKATYPWDGPDALATRREAVSLLSGGGGWAAQYAHWVGLLCAVVALGTVCIGPAPKAAGKPHLPVSTTHGRSRGITAVPNTTRHRSPLPRRSQQVERGGPTSS